MAELIVDQVRDAPGLRVRIDRPSHRNSLTLDVVRRLLAVLRANPDQTLLVGSSTEGIFSAGADLKVDDGERAALSDALYECYGHLITRPGISIAVVDGPAVGGGAQLSAAADLRLATSRARWRWVGPGHGLAVGAWILPDLVGRSLGLDLALSSRWFPAEEAATVAFARFVDEDPWMAAERLTVELHQADADALAAVKRIASDPSLISRLEAERHRNREQWNGRAPLPKH